MKRILSILGGVIAFGAAALAYLTAGAASGDIICEAPLVSAGLASQATKSALVSAINGTASGIVPANLDWVLCHQALPEAPGVWHCRAGESKSFASDAEWAAAEMAGELGASRPTAEQVKIYKSRQLSEGQKSLWGAVTQSAFGVPLGSVRMFRFSRQNPDALGQVTQEWVELLVLSPSAYKAARLADPPTCERGIGVVK